MTDSLETRYSPCVTTANFISVVQTETTVLYSVTARDTRAVIRGTTNVSKTLARGHNEARRSPATVDWYQILSAKMQGIITALVDGVMPGAKGQRGPLPLGKRKSLGPTSTDP